MSECSSSPLPWVFQLRSDNTGNPLTFEVVISEGVGNRVTGVITTVSDGSTSDLTFSDGLCQMEPLNNRPVLSFKLSINIDVNGSTVVKQIGVVGRVELITASSKRFAGGYFTLASTPGVGVAAIPDPGDSGTAGGSTGA